MYNNMAVQQSPTEEGDRQRRDNVAGPAQQLPQYHGSSPTLPHFNSYPPNHPHHSTYNSHYPSRSSGQSSMPMPTGIQQSPRLAPASSPTSNGRMSVNTSMQGARENSNSTYYDPTLEHREGNWRSSQYSAPSPLQNRNTNSYVDGLGDTRPLPSSHHSPLTSRFPQNSPTFLAAHAHPPSPRNSIPHSPAPSATESPVFRQTSSSFPTNMNGFAHRPSSQDGNRDSAPQQSQIISFDGQKPARTADPMAFSSILSSAPAEPKEANAPQPSHPAKRPRRSPIRANKENSTLATKPSPQPGRKPPTKVSSTPPRPAFSKKRAPEDVSRHCPVPARDTKPSLSDKENFSVQKAIADIDAMQLSDLDAPGWDAQKQQYSQKGKKRLLGIENSESEKRKRRRLITIRKLSNQCGAVAQAGIDRFKAEHEGPISEEVQRQDVLEEKERKKDMQRKRRREKTIQMETQKGKEALERANLAADHTAREKFIKEAQKAEKKAKSTRRILEHGESVDGGIREVTPLPLNHEGGTMSTFQAANHASPEPPKRKAGKGPTTRPKKTKEKKQAEKDAAEAAYAAMTKEELVPIAPKEENRRETLMRETKENRQIKELSPAPFITNYASKGYAQIYEQIWKDIARKDVPKVYRIKENSLTTKQNNLRKTAQLASKEARRWQLRTNKSMKDVQARAKRSMREMMTFWKRNERVERDLRKLAERQELDNAKKAEAEREENRQKRKLNFLISQTELYSHFIGRKVKTDEVERSTDQKDAAVSAVVDHAGRPAANALALHDDANKAGKKVTNIEDLDFDAEDETVLRQAAMANAQNAVQEAQDRARAFNGEGNQLQAQLDQGDVDFQNPTGLGEVDIEQPKMLTAQLKEYQLKGLQWLVNMYEQGINGILADEMGLGKTVQSISVMAYLAEKYNIWGPFLVIAPSSTLHNWQQEIARFVPDLKVLPYWGNAKDRKVLRKFWDRKHITYTKESPFHVLVTSYQLVVLDTQYFQKIRWQYMVLDEAQAIKSSQSSRWKSLLGFHCRNRLLLTGTPIQNSMQELWALLHFIMPGFFDNHEDFEKWFSRDIESHAQSNTKLNEDQLKRLHVILKPFMLRRVKKMVQKELGDKIELDVFCDLTYRQRAYYRNLRNRISIMDLIEKAAVGDDQDTATLMNLVMQFRKVCNHPDLFERADTSSPFSLVHYAETASFLREGTNINLDYSTRNLIDFDLPRLLCTPEARVDVAGPGNETAGFRSKYLHQLLSIWTPDNIQKTSTGSGAFAWLRFANTSAGEVYSASQNGIFQRAVDLKGNYSRLGRLNAIYSEDGHPSFTPNHALFNIVDRNERRPIAEVTTEGRMQCLLNVSKDAFEREGLNLLEQCARPAASAPPIQIACSDQSASIERENTLFNIPVRQALYSTSEKDEQALLDAKVEPHNFPITNMLPPPLSEKARYTNISVPSMRRFVTDSGKLAKLDELLFQLKDNGHRVLLYFQMTRMIDLMEEYLTYRNFKYLRLDGSTKLEDRRDTVHDFQTRPDIFVFLLSTRAGGLGINLTSADTVIFYDSDWNPTIDSQAMDRAHRLGQTKQVTVYRMITRGTIEERIRKRALQKEEVQRVVISGGGSAGVDFNTRSRENRSKDMALLLADDDQAELIERKEKEVAEMGAENKKGGKKSAKAGKKKDVSLDDMYHEGEGHFDDGSIKPSGTATPIDVAEGPASKGGKRAAPGTKSKGLSKKAKTAKQRLAIADAEGDLGMGA